MNFIINNLPTKTPSGADGFTAEFWKTLMEEVVGILNEVFQEMKQGTHLNLVYEDSTTLTGKLNKDTMRRQKAQQSTGVISTVF